MILDGITPVSVPSKPLISTPTEPPSSEKPLSIIIIGIIAASVILAIILYFKQPTPNLIISRKLNKTTIKEGEEIEIEISIQNKGKRITKSISFQESIPVGITASGETSWKDGRLIKNESNTLKYKIKPTKHGEYRLKPLTINYEDEKGKKYKSTITSQKIIVEKRIPPDISVSRTLKTKIREGEIFNVSITLDNRGKNAKSVAFSEEIPDGFSFISGDKSWNGDLKEKESRTFKYTLKSVKRGEYVFKGFIVKYNDERENEYESKLPSNTVIVEKETPTISSKIKISDKIFDDEMLKIEAVITNESNFVAIKNVTLNIDNVLKSFGILDIQKIDFLQPKGGETIISVLKPKKVGKFHFKPSIIYEDDEGKEYQEECVKKLIEIVERPRFSYGIQIPEEIREAQDFIIRVSVKNDSVYSTIKDVSFNFSGSAKDFSGEFKFDIPELRPKEKRVKNLSLKPEFSGEIAIVAKISYESDKKHHETREYKVEVKEREENLTTVEPSKIEIERGYEILQNNDIQFGVRITNNTDYAILDVQTILDYPKTLFSLKGNVVQTLANIHPNGERTAKYILTPKACIHNEKIDAIVRYKNHIGETRTVQMRGKEVHCVCPFLKEKPIREGEFAELVARSEHIEEGLSFSGIGTSEIAAFIKESCTHRLSTVSEHEIDNTIVLNLAGESIGEETYYLLTAVVQPYKEKDITQIALRAYSDKSHGLHGFLNEITASIRHLVGSVQSAREIGIIEEKQVINIIDSVVQKTRFGGVGQGGSAEVNIEGSVVHRSDVGGGDSDSREVTGQKREL